MTLTTNPFVPAERPSLADVLAAIDADPTMAPTRRRDLRSALNRLAALAGQDLATIPADMGVLRGHLAAIDLRAAGMSRKTLINLRSNLTSALQASGLRPVLRTSTIPLTPDWEALWAALGPGPEREALSRLMRYASANAIAPQDVDDDVMDAFAAAIAEASLVARPVALHRRARQIWNRIRVTLGRDDLQPVRPLSTRKPPRRVPWERLPDAFRAELAHHLAWCQGEDPFAADARPRAMAPASVKLRKDHIHAAVTAAIEAGIPIDQLQGLADLLAPETFKAILRQRHAARGGVPRVFERGLAKALIQMAHEIGGLDETQLGAMKRILARMPTEPPGLTDKNKALLRRLDDPELRRSLLRLPDLLWARATRPKRLTARHLRTAQVAVMLDLLLHAPIRFHNLARLRWDRHVLLPARPGLPAALVLAPGEVKNRIALEYELPAALADRLRTYRDRLVPDVLGEAAPWLFARTPARAKSQSTLAVALTSTLRAELGLDMTPHQFRHFAVKMILDDNPGNFELARQLLGHVGLKVTVQAYSGLDSRRAAHRFHEVLAAHRGETAPGSRS